MPLQEWHALWHSSVADASLWRALDLSNSQRPERALRYAASQPRILAALQVLNLEFAAGIVDALIMPLRDASLVALNLNGCQQYAHVHILPSVCTRSTWKASCISDIKHTHEAHPFLFGSLFVARATEGRESASPCYSAWYSVSLYCNLAMQSTGTGAEPDMLPGDLCAC